MGQDADARYLAMIQEDCERLLGPGIEVEALEWRSGPPVGLALRYRSGDREGETIGHGDTVIAAHADLRTRLVVDRVRLGFTILVETRR